MKKEIRLDLPLGYRLEDKIESVKVWQAEKCLLSKRGRRYTKAVRLDTDAQLYSRWLICPHCGERYVANANSAAFAEEICESAYAGRPSRKNILRWATMQLSLFEDQARDELLMAPPLESLAEFSCPDCGHVSYATSASRQVVLTHEKQKVSVRCEVVQIDEILTLEWGKRGEIKLCFPVFEVLTFDFRRGRVHIKMEDAQGRVLCQRDVSACPERIKGGAVYKVLSRNKVARRNLKRLFQAVWGGPLPYGWKQLDLAALVKMTMFVGYPRRFYDCIPYVQSSLQIDRGFCARAKRMHLAKNLNEVYRKSGLPRVKSMKRIMFSDPGLFFYTEEICGIWNAMGDYNLVARFLAGEQVYAILSSIHMRPGVLEYIRDYSRVKGGVYLLADMEENWERVRAWAIDYCCMGYRLRLEAQRGWRNRRNRDNVCLSEKAYSVPMCKPDETIRDCIINGYAFAWLRNSNDYVAAAKHLQNCLGGWQSSNAPVVGVRRKERYVAAIEVRNGCVVQARGLENRPVELDPDLHEVVELWMARFRLEWEEEDEADFFDDEPEYHFRALGNLPF